MQMDGVYEPRSLLSQWQTYLATALWQTSPDPTQKYSDGEVYCRVRFCQLAELEYLQDEWMSCLTASKQRNLSWLLERTSFTEILDMLVIFQGLWVGLELGNIRQLFALRCDEELQRYSSGIWKTWSKITLYDDEIGASVDVITAQSLQGRAPFASISDREAIIKDMDSGLLFSKVTNIRTRQRIQEEILGLDLIIPTIKTLHENSKLLGIGVQVIRRELTQDRSGSLFESLCSMWSPQASCFLETQEGIFTAVVRANDVDPAYLAYFLVFIAALRKFAKLGNAPPRRNIRSLPAQARIEPVDQTLFARRAKFLGYNGRQIQENCNLINGHLPVTPSPLTPHRKRKQDLRARCGRPHSYAYAEIERNLFITNLARARRDPSRTPSAMFILQDFLRAFFRPNVIYAEWVLIPRGVIDLTDPLPIGIRGTVRHHGSPQQIISEAHQTRSVPPSSMNPFLAYREPNTPLTATSINSQTSQQVSTSSLPMRDMHSSQVFDLASQLADTTMEVDSGDQIHQSQSPQRMSINSSPGGEFGQQTTTIYTQEADVEEDSSSTSTTDGGDDAWVSDGSTVVASGESNADRSSLDKSQFRSNLDLSQQTVDNSSFRSRLARRRGSVINQARRGRHGQRTFMMAKRFNSRRIGRFLGGQREAIRPSQLTEHQESESAYGTRSPKGKAILQNVDFIDGTQPGESSQPPDLLQSERTIEVGNGRRVRSYLALTQDGIESYERRPGFMPWRDEAIGSAGISRRRGRPARSYVRLPTGCESESSSSSTKGKEVVRLVAPAESSVEFLEYNGMKLLTKDTTNLTEYLKRRKGWVGMIVVDSELRTLRLDHISKYMEINRLEDSHPKLILVKQPHAERFRMNYFR